MQLSARHGRPCSIDVGKDNRRHLTVSCGVDKYLGARDDDNGEGSDEGGVGGQGGDAEGQQGLHKGPRGEHELGVRLSRAGRLVRAAALEHRHGRVAHVEHAACADTKL